MDFAAAVRALSAPAGRAATAASAATATKEPGLLDHVNKWCADTADGSRRWLRDQSPWLRDRVDDVGNVAAEADRKGYGKYFGDFNKRLVRPFTGSYSEVVSELRRNITWNLL